MEIKMYISITGARAALPNAKMVSKVNTRRSCCFHVSRMLNDLILSENMGIGETSRAD